MLASEMRWTRMAAATRMASVLAWESRRETEQTETTHAIASLRCMIETPFRLCLGGPPEPVTGGLGPFSSGGTGMSAPPIFGHMRLPSNTRFAPARGSKGRSDFQAALPHRADLGGGESC